MSLLVYAKMALTELINSSREPINLIEIYAISPKSPDKLKHITMGSPTSTVITEFHTQDMIYSYDKMNDAQRVTRRKCHITRDTHAHNKFGLYEDVLPTHLFPCTDEILHKTTIQRTVYRVNNRMFIYVDIEIEPDCENTYVYIRYNHTDNIDLVKMELDLNRILPAI